MTTRKDMTILDDGAYFVALATPLAGRGSAGLLERRCAISQTAPSGSRCVGTFFRMATGLWAARVSTDFDATTGLAYREVVRDVSRIEAIAALWTTRHCAFIADHS